MAASDNTELLKSLDRLRGTIESLSRITETSETRRRQRVEGGGGEFKPKDVKKTFTEFYVSVGKASKSFKDTAEAMTDLHEAAHLTSEEHDKLTASILKSSNIIELYNDQTHKTIRSMRQFDEENRRTAANLDDVFSMLDKEINGSTKKYAELIKHIKDANGDYKKIRGTALTYMMAINDAKDSIKGFEKGLDSSLEEIQKAYDAAAKKQKAIQENTKRNYAAAQAASNIQQKFGVFGEAITGVASKAVIAGAILTELWKGAKLAWDQLTILGKAGLASEFGNIWNSSFHLGVNFEKMTAITKDSMAAMRLSKKNIDEFTKEVSANQNALTAFTYSTEDSAAGLMAMRSDLLDMGAAFDNTPTLNKAMASQTASFAKLNAMTGASMEEFIRLNKELGTSSSVQMMLLGLDKKARLQKIEDLKQAREYYATMGMSAQEAQEMVKRIQDIGKEKVVDRFEQAAQLRRSMTMLGIAGGAEAQQNLLSGKFRNDPEAAKKLQAAIQATQVGLDRWKMSNNIQKELQADTLIATLGPLFNQFSDSNRQNQLRQEAADDKRIIADAEARKQQASDGTLFLKELGGKFDAIMSGPLGNIIKAGGFAAAGLFGGKLWSKGKDWFVNRGASKTAEGAAEDAGKIAKKSGGKVLGFLGRFGEAFGKIATKIPWEGMGRMLGKTLGPIAIIGESLFNMSKTAEIFGKEANNVSFSQLLTTYFMGFPKMIGKIIDSIFGTDAESLFDTSTIVISRFFTDLYDGVVDFFQYSWDLVTGHGSDLFDKLSLVMKRVIHSFGNIMSNIADMMQEAPDTIFSMYDRYFGDDEAKERSRKYDEVRAKAKTERDAQHAQDNKAFEDSIKAEMQKITQKRAESDAAFKAQQASKKSEKDKQRAQEDDAFVQTMVNRNRKKAADAAKKDAEEAAAKNKNANNALSQLMSDPKSFLGLTNWANLSNNLAQTVTSGGTTGISGGPTINSNVAPIVAAQAATSSGNASPTATTEKTEETTLADVAALLQKLVDIEQKNLTSQQDQFDYMKSLKGSGLAGAAAATVLDAFGNSFSSKFDMSQRA